MNEKKGLLQILKQGYKNLLSKTRLGTVISFIYIKVRILTFT